MVTDEASVRVGAATLNKLKPVAVVIPVEPVTVAVVAGIFTPFHTAPAADATVMVGVNSVRPFTTFKVLPVVVPVLPLRYTTFPVVLALPKTLKAVPALVDVELTCKSAAFAVDVKLAVELIDTMPFVAKLPAPE